MRKGEILAKYNERVVELREKGLQIKDLIERAKTEADDGLGSNCTSEAVCYVNLL